jgi:hypothetical protein
MVKNNRKCYKKIISVTELLMAAWNACCVRVRVLPRLVSFNLRERPFSTSRSIKKEGVKKEKYYTIKLKNVL